MVVMLNKSYFSFSSERRNSRRGGGGHSLVIILGDAFTSVSRGIQHNISP